MQYSIVLLYPVVYSPVSFPASCASNAELSLAVTTAIGALYVRNSLQIYLCIFIIKCVPAARLREPCFVLRLSRSKPWLQNLISACASKAFVYSAYSRSQAECLACSSSVPGTAPLPLHLLLLLVAMMSVCCSIAAQVGLKASSLVVWPRNVIQLSYPVAQS